MYPSPALIEAQTSFDLDTYINNRFGTGAYTMTEIGHDAVPVAFVQPTNFTGQHVYIGIEAWLRDPGGYKHTELADLRRAHPNYRNVFFISHDIGGTIYRDNEEGECQSWLNGEYDTATVLPDGIADEVLVSNVLSDPHIAFSAERKIALLQEASRLLRAGGKLVLRHTITPERSFLTKPEQFMDVSLAPEAAFTPNDESAWDQLEAVYRAKPKEGFTLPPQPNSHYLFFTKE